MWPLSSIYIDKMYHSKLILQVLYCFFLIAACHVIIEMVLYIYMHYGLRNDFREIHFKYYMLALGVTFAILLGILVLKGFILNKATEEGLPEFSKVGLVVFIVIVALLPVFRHFSNQWFMNMYSDIQMTRYLSNRDINAIFSTADFSVLISKWVFILTLLTYSGYLYLKKN